MNKRLKSLAALVAATGLLAACTADDESDTPAPTGEGVLADICPANIVIQIDWFATPERAAALQLVGPDGTVDVNKGAYTGPLGDTGVNAEVRLGGPFLGGQPVTAQMYADDSITLGYVSTDTALRTNAEFPVTGVFASLDINPQIVMWDPETYDIGSWDDVAATEAPIIYSEGEPYMDYLIANGYVDESQADASFDGSPARFVAERGEVIQQGYVSNEPYRWENDVEDWQKPVDYLLVHESGYEIYPQGWSVRSGELAEMSDCLTELVPMLQQAQVDYVNDPEPVNEAILRISETIPDGPPITLEGNASSAEVQLSEGIVSNGPDATLGNFDEERIDRVIASLLPIFEGYGEEIPEGISAADLVTNEFIDESIGLD